MSYELIEEIVHDYRLSSIPSSIPDSIITFKSSFFYEFNDMNSFKVGNSIGLVNSSYTFPLAEMVPIRTSGGLWPPSPLPDNAACLANYLCFRIVAKNNANI